MNITKLTQQLDRRAEALDRRTAKSSNREPLPEVNKLIYREKVYYEDAYIDATIFDVREYLSGEYKGVSFNQRGPWVLFKVNEIISGDYNGQIAEGSVILAKWDRSYKVYKKFIYDGYPKYGDKELEAITSFISVTETELITGKLN
jgi:hypothetical protein